MRQLQDILIKGLLFFIGGIVLTTMTTISVYGQCTPVDGEISGHIYLDKNMNGLNDDEAPLSSILVNAFDGNGNLVDHTFSDLLGNYTLDGLNASETYRVEFRHGPKLSPSKLGADNESPIVFTTANRCDLHFGLLEEGTQYGVNPTMALTCFVQGNPTENLNMATIVSVPHDFYPSTGPTMYSNKQETGAVWGLAYKSQTDQMFSASFIKQYASLGYDVDGKAMHDAIYVTSNMTGTPSSALYTRLSDLGITLAPLTVEDPIDCAYGDQVGRKGLGSLEISDDESTLYVVNISNNSVVSIPTTNPTAANTKEIKDLYKATSGNAYAFALKYYKHKLYVGFTVTTDDFNDPSSASKMVVVEYDLNTAVKQVIFESNYLKGQFTDDLFTNFTIRVQQWFTDIEFLDDATMVVALNDRKGNRFCATSQANRLDDEKGDVLVVYKNDAGVWTLESGGVYAGKVGQKTNNGQGPGGGEFFGADEFTEDPDHHNEVSLGSIYNVPGKSEMLSTVFDPYLNTYSGGLHRYSTLDGHRVSAVELYSSNAVTLFGKATGFGEIEMIAPKGDIEIGNYVWHDLNNNGIQDAGEPAIAGLALDLYDAQCNKIGSTETNATGNYVFNKQNTNGIGIAPYTNYYVVVADASYSKESASIQVNGQDLILTSVKESAYYPKNNDAKIASDVCESLNGLAIVELQTKGAGENIYAFDIGFADPGAFDLALTKTYVEGKYAVAGKAATFKIVVENQGQIGAKSIVVKEHIPAGLAFDESKNNGWVLDGATATYTIDALARQEQQELLIHFYIKPGYSYDNFTNCAEIASANDQFNKVAKDVDSTPNDLVVDQKGGPSQTDLADDDQDCAAIRVFDLALTKKLVNVKSSYVSGSIAEFEITVYNQGNETATNVKVSDYLPKELSLEPNQKWTLDGQRAEYLVQSLEAGQSINIPIITKITSDQMAAVIVNTAEISEAHTSNGDLAVDYDSTPNTNPDDDLGGEPGSPTDDVIDASPSVDEDDHDAASVTIERFDLSLKKTTTSSMVKHGEIIEYTITVFNEGTVVANNVKLVDYTPEYLEYVPSAGWTIDPATQYPVAMLSTESGHFPVGGLLPGNSADITIRCKVKSDAPAGTLMNMAEIVSTTDFDGNDRSKQDYDSTPDMTDSNDGTLPVMEDDIAMAPVELLTIVQAGTCDCLTNSKTNALGQFFTTFVFEGNPSHEWTIIEATNFYSPYGGNKNIDNPLIGVQLPLDSPLNYIVYSDGTQFSLQGIVLDGQDYSITLSNGVPGSAPITLTGAACNYNPTIITGPVGACVNSTITFCVEELSGSTFTWELPAGGTIVGPADQACVDVQWQATAGGPFDLGVNIVSDIHPCQQAAVKKVTVGSGSGEIAVVSDINVSLDANCEVQVTPDLLLTGDGLYTDMAFDVIVMDAAGNMLPEPVITSAYVGETMTVKLVEVCSGNAAWSTFKVFDKMKPTIEVEDLQIHCIDQSTVPYPVGLDNCSANVEVIKTSEVTNQLMCNDSFTYEIIRTFKAVDASGNESEEVTQKINMLRVNLDSIKFPIDRTLDDKNPIFCQQFVANEAGYPDPASAGVPTYEGMNIYPYVDQYCSFGITYTDQLIGLEGGCITKIMRTWVASEWWCNQSLVKTHVQILNIADQESPNFKAPADVTITTDLEKCFGTYNIPAINPVDDCSTSFEIDIAYPGNFLDNQNGGIAQLELGENIITHTVTDACGNKTTKSHRVTVEDNTVPVMACDQNTVISLKSDGTAYAPAKVFDDGSITDCSALTFKVKRMDNGAACNIANYSFEDYVHFCCADLGTPVLVSVQATDANGNTNTCMVNVIIQDKNPPAITAPADLTIQCTDSYDLNDLSPFGSATASATCTIDTIIETVSSNITACKVGSITRTFTAVSGAQQATAQQVITIQNDFNFSDKNIDWPNDYTTTTCGLNNLQPDDLVYPYDKPRFTSNACDLIEIASTDKVFTTSSDACYKIIRTWMVMDMCQLDSFGNPLMWVKDQAIVVTNNVAPVIQSSCAPDSVTVLDNCNEGTITLGATATDDCTDVDKLQYSYNIDLNQDGSFDIVNTGLGGTISLTETLPIGVHSIVYRFEDRCGNTATCTQEFKIKNGTPPTPYCQDLAVELTPMDLDGDGIYDTEMTSVDVKLIGSKSSHPCGYPVTLSYDAAGDSTVAVFDCFDLGLNVVTVYVTDTFGNQASCTADIVVQDNNTVDVCPSPKDCIIWPEDLNVTTCVADLEPTTLNSFATVSLPCVCEDFTITHTDATVVGANPACVTVERTWKVAFNCFATSLEYTHVQTITQVNAAAPTITQCPTDKTGSANSTTCTANVVIELPVVDASCNTVIQITNNSPYATSAQGAATGNYPVGTTTVVYTVTDACGNASTCALDVVVTDGEAPTCVTQDITVNITDPSGIVTITDDQVNNGSSDACGTIQSIVTNPKSFDCTKLGANTVTMTVTDNSNNTSQCTATVTVVDKIDPVAVCADPETVTIQIFNPGVEFPVPVNFINNGSYDDCSGIDTMFVGPETFSCDSIGVREVTLTVVDNDGNSSTCTTTVIVTDNVAPVAIAKDITVAIGMDNCAVITGEMVDNGSYDPCGTIESYMVTPDTFKCDQLGPNDVVLKVTDDAGNTATDVAVVTVVSNDTVMCVSQDYTAYLNSFGEVKITPMDIDGGSTAPCNAPIEMSISDSLFYCNDAQTNPHPVLLTITNSLTGEMDTCTAMITVLDTITPTVTCPSDVTINCSDDLTDASLYGVVVYGDNCLSSASFDTIVNTNVNNCGIGTMTRIYKITDASGNVDSCTQNVTIEPSSTNQFTEANIIWPASTVTANSCGSITPEDLNSFPTIDTMSAACFDVSYTYVDSSYSNSMNCIDTIQRVFTVTDACQTNVSFDFTQLVYVTDTVAPVFVGISMDTLVVASDTACHAFVDLSGLMVEDCSTDLTFTNTGSNPANANTLDASGVYVNNDVINYTATDACGNVSSYSITIMVEDQTAPDYTCIKQFPEIGADGTVTVTPNLYIQNFSDNCTDSINATFYFVHDYTEGDTDLSDNNLATDTLFDCNDVGNLQVLFIAVVDEAGNFRVCGSQTTVVDPNNECPGAPIMNTVSGEVATVSGQGIAATMISIDGTSTTSQVSDQNGNFNISGLAGGSIINVTPRKDTDWLNGVTTLDALLVEKHIDGSATLTNPYNLIAADADNSGSIALNDVAAIQGLILNEFSSIEGNTSFRFVDSEYTFTDPTNPWTSEFPESRSIAYLYGVSVNNFVGIKVGDIDGSYQGRVQQDGPDQIFVKPRSVHDLRLEKGVSESVNGYVDVPVYSSEFAALRALEMTIDFHTGTVAEIIPGLVDISSKEWTAFRGGKSLKISWINHEALNVRQDELMFTIRLKSNRSITAMDEVKLAKGINEFYTTDVDIADLRFIDERANLRAKLYQNTPNPFGQETMIAFNMVNTADYTFNFYDVDGRLLFTKTGSGTKGLNNITVSKTDLNTQSGVIIYEFVSGQRRLTKRMMLLE